MSSAFPRTRPYALRHIIILYAMGVAIRTDKTEGMERHDFFCLLVNGTERNENGNFLTPVLTQHSRGSPQECVSDPSEVKPLPRG